MATLNVGEMAARLGLDTSDFLEKMKGLEGFSSASSQRIAAEMKRSSREGAESLRLIDEALGIHMSRPLTRILTQEFPALAEGLQSILGVGVIGALGVIGIEFFDKIAKGIEKATKAQEDLQRATEKTRDVYATALDSFAKDEKLRSLSGLDKTLFQIDSSSIGDTRKKIDELAAATDAEAKAALNAQKWTTELLAGLGDALHVLFTSPGTLGVETIGKNLDEFRKKFDELSRIDALAGSHQGAVALTAEIDKAEKALAAMTALRLTPFENFERAIAPVSGHMIVGFSDAELAAQKLYLDNLQKIKAILDAGRKDATGKGDEARNADAAEREAKALTAISALYGDIAAGIAKAQPQTNGFEKLRIELTELRFKADNDFQEIGLTSASALSMRAALANLEAYGRKLDSVLAEAKALADLPSKLPAGSFGPAPTFTAIAQLPQMSLAAPRADLAELKAVQTDVNAAWAKAGEVLNQIESPLQKYETGLRVLTELEQQHRISGDELTAAKQRLSEELDLAETHVQKLERAMVKLLQRTDSASAGFKAFALNLQIEGAQTGKFTFDFLTQGLKGFEDETARAIITGQSNWRQYFQSLEAMALKFALNKTLSSLLQNVPGLGGLASGGSTSAAAATQLSAGTIMQTAATTQLAAAQLMLASGAGSVGGGGGILSSILPAGLPLLAGGGDLMPGASAIVGDQGPEVFTAGTAGGTVSPNSSITGSGGHGHTFNFRIDNRGADVAAVARLERMMPVMRDQAVQIAVTTVNEIARRTAR